MPKTSTKAAEAGLDKFEKTMAKRYGEGRLDRSGTIVEYETVSTGSMLLDVATGVGGLVMGRLHEWWGIDSVGKTFMAILAMIEAQRKYPERMVAVVNVEHTWDKKWAQTLGLDLTRCYIFHPDTAEDVADVVRDLICEPPEKHGLPPFSMILVDSIGAMIPKKELEKLADEAVVALQAKIVTRMVKKNSVYADRHGVCVLMINQVRANVSGYGNPNTTGGGHALKHGTTMKMLFKRTGTDPYKVKEDGVEITVGHEMSVLLERNKVAPSKTSALLSVYFVPSEKYGPLGVDRADEAARLGRRFGLIHQDGAWYTLWTGEKMQGLDTVTDHLRTHPDLIQEVRQRVLDLHAGMVVDDTDDEGDEGEGE
jgi:recombination protein RecA